MRRVGSKIQLKKKTKVGPDMERCSEFCVGADLKSIGLLSENESFMRIVETFGAYYVLDLARSPQPAQVWKLVSHRNGFDVTTPSGAILTAPFWILKQTFTHFI